MLKFKMGLQSLPSMLFLKTATLVQGYKVHISMFYKGPFSVFDHFVFTFPLPDPRPAASTLFGIYCCHETAPT